MMKSHENERKKERIHFDFLDFYTHGLHIYACLLYRLLLYIFKTIAYIYN